MPDSTSDADVHGSEDATLGGYFRVHERPPAFEGIDGHPYTVSLEVEKTPDLRAPYAGYLVFPRWAKNGLGVVGHVETETLWRGRSEEAVKEAAGIEPLEKVKGWLDAAVERKARRDEASAPGEGSSEREYE